MPIGKKRNTKERVLLNCTPPRKIMPLLIEWWLILRKDNNNFRCAEITAIESVNVEDPYDFFWRYSKVFVDNEEPAQNMIISANSKTGIIEYYPEDANGDPFIHAVTHRVAKKTMYHHNILIYHCTGIIEKVFLDSLEAVPPKQKEMKMDSLRKRAMAQMITQEEIKRNLEK